MADQPKPAPDRADAGRFDEERLAHALISRGLLTAEEVAPVKGAGGADGLLERLVSVGLLTRNQGKRVQGEMTMLLGQQIPGYQILEKIGAGAMGVVYKARQVSMNRLVAIKVLQPKLAANAGFLERLKHEAHIAARLSHNNIVQAIDVGSAGPLHYFVMELVEGKTIRQDLDAGKVYEEREAVDIICQVAQALSHAHRRGLIHRDVKPANIVLTPDGVAKLADLGLARSTTDEAMAQSERGLTVGTPYYISPEQIEGRMDVDGRADIYSLGATLYHMVTGQPPYPYKKVEDVLEAHLNEELTPPDHVNAKLSTGIGEVVEWMLAKDRRQRYRNADDLIIDLECLLAEEAPKLARQHIEASTLHELAEGEAEERRRPVREEREERDEPEEPVLAPTWAWVAVLGGLLGLSMLLNLILMTRRH
jgi:serine/threonine-protein kinase